jgi:hypothetical protein
VAGRLQGGDGLSGPPPRPILARQRARGGADGWVHRRRASGSDGDGDTPALLDKKRGTTLAPGLAEKRDGAREEQGEMADIDPRLLPSTLAPARILGLCCPGKAMASLAGLREEREWSEGANGQQGMAPEGARGFNGLA